MYIVAWPIERSTPTREGVDKRPRYPGRASPTVSDVTILRMDHVGLVVDDLEAAISFFVELGMELNQVARDTRRG